MASFAQLVPASEPAVRTDSLRVGRVACVARHGLSSSHAVSALWALLGWCAAWGVDQL
jgi:hypothetical protein